MTRVCKNYRHVAIVTDTIFKYGGAEKVLEVFLQMFPESDLYTLFIVPAARKKIKKKFPKVKIHTSCFQWLIKSDYVSKYISVIKLFSWVYWEVLNLKKCDLIISSSHSYMSKNVKKRINAFHMSYIHTPPRFLYDEYCELNFIKKFPINFILWPFIKLLRWVDNKGTKRPDVILVNSENVKRRVKKYYDRDSVVIYPPVEVPTTKIIIKKENYFVCLSRLVKQKGIDLVIRTCTSNSIPLIVVGNGDEFRRLKKMAGKTIKFIKKCGDKRKNKILAKAKGLIYASIEEDFGMVPIEALSVGTPVIAFWSGGVKESILENHTGVFFKKFNSSLLMRAIYKFEKLNFDLDLLKKESKKYNTNNFKKSVFKIIEQYK